MSLTGGTTLDETIVVARRYNGPANSGNGGYVAGLVAARIHGPAEVTLRVPPPLETRMHILQDNGTMRLMDGDETVAEGKSATVELDVPAQPSFEQATAAVANYSGFKEHTFPTCFVCGPQRAEGDGLRIFAGSFDASNAVAAPWIPDSAFGVDGKIPTEIHWAALDCPGAFAVMQRDVPVVLGRMSAEIIRPVSPSEKCVVVGWPIGADGRKHFAGTALFNQAGGLAARAVQTWIQLKQ
jgi:hypothetical protein